MTNHTSLDMVTTRFAGPIYNTSLDTANSCVLQLCDLLFSTTLWWQHSFSTGSKGSSTGTAAGSSSTNGAGRLVASSALFALLGVVVVFL
ncbi:hypothetical protein PILCRDRAFT_194705 [Piloderma croceum F 1598]|uniref:Uncharacterized protein n=1 Tax=Piloderma croceum (strain F 1598) TaxID=765440 RepID=A0A0C3GDF3_PILCF|nr:hypothetical protein PILCRDRAFT_194705 [Piloderma croceum F 1598]